MNAHRGEDGASRLEQVRSATAALADLAFAASAAEPAAGLSTSAASAFASIATDPLDLDLGDPQQSHFGDYTLLARIGQGGMGVVYRAHQHSLDREVAVKLLAAGPWASPDFIERFRFEAQSAARMQHPNIITIFEAGAHDGLPFFSMRYVRGQSLAERLRQRGPLPARSAAQLIRTVAEAVDYAHRLGVLHLDLKPGNVLLDENEEPMVADFGLSRQLEQAVRGEPAEVSGTPSYMAPEQAISSPSLTPATDVHALGATLFEALTGRPPFRAANARETLQHVVMGMPPTLRSIDHRLPLDLQAICLKCLQKDPKQRYASARLMAEDLGRYLEGREVQARPLGPARRSWRLVRREPRLSALAALFVIALVGGTTATTLQWQRAEASAQSARESLWRMRSNAAQTALADADGFRGLGKMIANLAEMEAAGRHEDARIERQRIGTTLANAPQLVDVRQLPQGESITSVAIAPDGERFAIALHEPDGTRLIRHYDARSGEPLWTTVTDGLSHGLPHGSGMPHGWLRYSTDGGMLLAGMMQQPPFAAPSASDTIALDADSGEPMVPPRSLGEYADVLYSDDGSRALVRQRSDRRQRFPDRVQLFNPHDWTPLGPPRDARSLDGSIDFHFSPDGRRLLATADFITFRLLQSDGFRVLWRTTLPEGDQVRAWRFSDDGRWLALGTQSGRVYLAASEDGILRSLVSPPVAAVRWLEFDSAATTLAAQAEDGSLMAWRVADGRPRTSLIREGGRGLGRVRLNGDLMTTATAERVRSWTLVPESPFDLAAIQAAAQLRNRRVWSAHAFDVHEGTQSLVAGGVDGLLSVWRLPPPVVTPWRAAPLPAGTLGFDGRRIVDVQGHRVQIQTVGANAATHPRLDHPEPVQFAELSHDGRHLVTIAGRTVRVVDPDTGRLYGDPLLLPQTPRRAELAPAAPVLALTTGEYVGHTFHERLHVIDLPSGRAREGQWRIPGIIERLLLAPDGSRALVLAVTTPVVDNDPQLIDLLSGYSRCNRLEIDDGHWVVDAAFAEDGNSLWTTTTLEDRMTRLSRWDLGTCTALTRLEVPSSGAFRKLRPVRDSVVVSALSGDEISIVDGAGTRREIPALPRSQTMFDMAVSRDGRRGAQASRNAVRVYDLVRGEVLSAALSAPIAGNDAIAKLAFSPDTEHLLGRTYKGRWLLWRLPQSSEPVDRLAALAGLLDAETDTPLPPAHRAESLRDYLRERDPGPTRRVRQAPVRRIDYARAAGSGVDPRYTPLDLGPLHNVPLNGAWPAHPGMGGEVANLAPGLQRFNGVDWRIEGGIQLVGGSYGIYFHRHHPRTAWLAFAPQRIAQVHALLLRHVPHSARDQPRDQAYVVLRGSDGREHRLPIVHMRDVVQHAMPNTMNAAQARGRIAWSGVHGAAVRSGDFSSSHTPSHAWAVALAVPPDAGPIDALRLEVAAGPIESPLFYALTLEHP